MAVYVWYRKAFKERDFKRSWQDQIRPNRSDDGGIDWVSCRNNLTLLEHFTSSTRPGQRSARGGFSFTGLYLRSELCHHSFPTPTPPHATGSVHLWAPQNAFVHCVYFSRSVGRISRKSRLFFFFPLLGTTAVSNPRRHDIMRQTDACNRQHLVTAFHLSHHAKVSFTLPEFWITATQFFLEFRLSARRAECRRVVIEVCSGVERWDVQCHSEAVAGRVKG